jgi:hypothetical protein
MVAIAVLLPAAACAIGCLLWLEVRKYRSGQQIISLRRFRLRLAAGVLAIVLCVALFAILFVLPHDFMHAHPALALAALTLCLAVAIALIWIMLADIQEVESRLSQREHEIWRDFARLVAAKHGRGRRPSDGGEQGETKP